PTSHVDLFNENCVRLCDELNPTRLELNQARELSARERFEVAKVLAAISILCNRPFFAKTSLELLNHKEKEAVDFNMAAILLPAGTTFSEFKETLNTGLFSARGEQMLGWAQQTFAEFLASEWAASSKLTKEDLWQLTTIDDGETRRVIPQLTTCAAWLSEMRRGYRTKVLKYDPAVLLNADETALDPRIRRKLVSRILQLIQSGAAAHSFRYQFNKLCHKHLARKIRPLLRRRNKSQQVRYAAIMIAESCKVKQLESDLLQLTLNQHEELFLRSAGAFSISQFGSDETRLALRPTASLANNLDVDDDLKGWSLYALWPGNINALDV